MRMSKMFLQTEKEDPKDADIVSYKLLIKAGYIRKLVSGVYHFLPLGLRVLRNVEKITREEMNRSGAEEILCSALQPKELWDESGRWEKYGAGLMRLKDRNEREFCLGPTHEEIFTEIVRKQIKSYKQLPMIIYQIQTKYRDEKRPRFGLIRAKEFLMKDAYSFGVNEKDLDEAYHVMYDTYKRIFDRCGLKYKAVLADTGAIGGDGSHQFMALSDVGESAILYCSKCDYAADQEKAETKFEKKEEKLKEIKIVETKDKKTIEEVATFLGVETKNCAKSVVYKTGERIILVLVRGDRHVNLAKLCNITGAGEEELLFAEDDEIKKYLSTEPGFIGPVGLKCEMIIDKELANTPNFITGANLRDQHVLNVNFKRDFEATVADIIEVVEGDRCPLCGMPLLMERGIEVGQIFKLGTKYSEKMHCDFTDLDGVEKPMYMGCYGIGVSRTIAAIIEQSYDADGIVWPKEIAPYKYMVIPANMKDMVQVTLAEELYKRLLEKNLEVILDDRDERPGVKFKDTDLLGIPHRIVVGRKAGENIVEFKQRANKESSEITVEELLNQI